MKALAGKLLASVVVVGIGALVGGMVPMVGQSVAGSAPAVEPVVAVGPSACEAAVYPYIPAECLHRADGAPVTDVRWITIETRVDGVNASVLTTTPVLVD
jgi:hypothetical protein